MSASATARTRAYRAFSRLGHERTDVIDRLPGGSWLLRSVGNRLGRGAVSVAGGLGAGLKLDASYLPPRHIQAYGLVRGSLEPSVQEAFRRTIGPGCSVIDVGANIGFFSLLASRLAGQAGKVCAVEALPENVRALRANCALNGAGNVSVVEAAATDHAGRGSFLQVAEHSWSHLADRGWHEATTAAIDVELATIDGLIAQERAPRPDVVKVDVEGSEAAVLDGMAQTLREAAPTLIIELHGTNTEVLERLALVGYSAENLDGPEPIESAGPVHLLARPRRSAEA